LAPPQRVLVVDDDPYYRDTIRDALALEGIACEVASGSAELLKATEDPRLACVVLDVKLAAPASFAQRAAGERSPSFGIGLLETLLEQRPALRVIALATQDDQELVLAALHSGACDYLAKPIHDEELCLAVGRALRGHEVESRWDSLRERMRRLAEHGDAIERTARGGAVREAIAARAVAAAAEVLDAARAGLLVTSGDGAPTALASEGPPFEREDEADVTAGFEVDAGVRAALCAGARRGGGAFGAEDEVLLRLLARSAAPWLAARAPEPAVAPTPPAAVPSAADDADRDGDADLLRAIAEGMTREVEPARLLAASLRPIARATSARVVSLYLIDNTTGRLVCEAQCEGSDLDRADLPRGAGLTGGSLQSGAIVATDRPARDARFDAEVDTPESGTPGPLIVIPLRVRERVLGVARVFPSEAVGASARLAELLAAPLSAATRNVLLYRSLLESVEDVARARRESEGRR
jgi:FixJ family two-component response regulator